MLGIALYHLKKPFHFIKTGILQGIPANLKYKHPAKELTIITITGTDGKTTSSTMLYHVLKKSGVQAGLLSTVAAYIGDEAVDTGFHVTSPQPKQLLGFLRKMVDAGITHVVLEVTSHGEYQFRTWGVTPKLSGITNVAHEHLDYHQTKELYLDAKRAILAKAPTIVLNKDDGSYRYLASKLKSHRTIPYGSEYELPSKVSQAISATFPEKYNQQNAKLVYNLAKELGVTDSQFATSIKSFPGVPGRMQEVKTKKPFTTIVDFAHTPQGLEAALHSLKEKLKKQKEGKLIAIYGCAGLRDHAKRPIMGKIGTDIADQVIFTAEDPRTEDVWSIIRAMKENVTHLEKVTTIVDRQKAISFAINTLAKKNDIVVVLGKGHEQSMCFGQTEYPWSDVAAIKRATIHSSKDNSRVAHTV